MIFHQGILKDHFTGYADMHDHRYNPPPGPQWVATPWMPHCGAVGQGRGFRIGLRGGVRCGMVGLKADGHSAIVWKGMILAVLAFKFPNFKWNLPSDYST